MLKALKKRLKDQRGLTLIELLAVVVILGIISAIAVPNITGIINKADKEAEVAEALQIINAAKIANTASNSKDVTFTHTGKGYAANDNNTYLSLGDYLDNVEDQTYSVTYSATNKTYSITDHSSASLFGSDSTVTEKELIDYNK